jgi:Circularly permutated YpsA SLOG family/ATP phosphoribosyltransferase
MVATVGALDRTTWDLTVVVAPAAARHALASRGLATGGGWLAGDDELVLDLAERLAAPGRPTWAAGGAASNALAAMAACQAPSGPELALWWFGVTAPMDVQREPLAGPLDALRRGGIIPMSLQRAARHTYRLHLIDETTGAILATVRSSPHPSASPSAGGTHRPYGEPAPGSVPAPDALIVSAADLPLDGTFWQLAAGVPALAVLLGEGAGLDREARDSLLLLARSGTLRWVLGPAPALAAAGLVVGGAPARDLHGVELVATCDGSGPAMVWPPGSRVPCRLGPGRPAGRGGDPIGASDAYAGAWLHGRLLGADVEAAHGGATALAWRVRASQGARLAPEQDLNRLFAEPTGRSSEHHDEGLLFERVRRAAGLVVLSGGQTGVDQLALEAAARLGLPAFCVLPAGWRTETTEGLTPGPDRFADAHVEVLGAHSYRYRTWTTVWLADATLIWDYHTSEGCATARDACGALGRPYLDVAHLDEDERRQQVWEFAARHGVRVINVEGNRGSLLTGTEASMAAAQLFDLLRVVAARERQQRLPPMPTAPPVPAVDPAGSTGPERPPLALGVPTVPAQRKLVEAFLRETYGLDLPEGRAMVVGYPERRLEVVFARARDLPPLLRTGAIDLALCGSDLLDPAAGDMALFDTGLSPLLLVLVGRGGAGGSLAERLAARRAGSQDRLLALRLLREALGYRGDIHEIEGTAETWIRRGVLDVAVDTWSTGATAQANGLDLLRVFGETSLVLAGRAPGIARPSSGAQAFLAAFAAWLTGAEHQPAATRDGGEH